MLLNYLRTSLKNLLKHRLFTLINLGGLSIGLAASILIALYVQDETSYDKHWSNAEQLYRINTATDRGNGFVRGGATSAAALSALKLAFPDEIVRGSRLMDFERELEYGDLHLEEVIPMVDRDIVDMFDFEVLAGDLRAALSDASSIALSSDLAGRIFGAQEPLGEVLTLSLNGVSRDFRVGAVYRLPPGNRVLDLPAMILLDEAALPSQFMTNWGAQILRSYVQLSPNAQVERLEASLPAVVDRNVPTTVTDGVVPSQRYRLELQNVRDLHLHSGFDSSRAGGNSTTVLAFSAIAVLVLLIGCINFTVLSTAKAVQRTREVAVRKSVGANRLQLMRQYLGESFLVVLPAILLALVLVELLLPAFESLVGRALTLSWTAPGTYGALLILFLAVGIAGGLYPAFVLSRPRPQAILNGARTREGPGAARLHKVLTVFQFSISIALMASTAVIHTQVSFASNRDPGFNPDEVLVIDNLLMRGDVSARKAALKQAVDSHPNVVASAFSVHQPTQKLGMANNFLSYTLAGDSNIHRLATVTVGHDFFSTYQIPLLAGRDLASDQDLPSRLMQSLPADEEAGERNVIINASAARELGFASAAEAIGARLHGRTASNTDGEVLAVVGVVADTHFLSLNAVPRAEVYLPAPDFADVLSVRFRGDPQDLLADMTDLWREVMGDAELSFSFVEQNMAAEFEQARTEVRILVSFAALAIVIACLGLFGSATANVERRGKEISIRKVMGAEVREIVLLLLWQFTRPVMFANLVAWPVAIWAMLNWLQQFPYQIEAWLLLPLCGLAGLTALVIAWVTVAGNTWRAAGRNPVYSLRYE